MCGGCGSLLYLTGERRLRRYFLLALPTFLLVGNFGFILFRRIDGLNIYREAREAYEPNFMGFLLICAALYVSVSLLGRFEVVGIAAKPDIKGKEPVSNS